MPLLIKIPHFCSAGQIRLVRTRRFNYLCKNRTRLHPISNLLKAHLYLRIEFSLDFVLGKRGDVHSIWYVLSKGKGVSALVQTAASCQYTRGGSQTDGGLINGAPRPSPNICSAAASDRNMADTKTTWLKWVINGRQTFRRFSPPAIYRLTNPPPGGKGGWNVQRWTMSAHLAENSWRQSALGE